MYVPAWLGSTVCTFHMYAGATGKRDVYIFDMQARLGAGCAFSDVPTHLRSRMYACYMGRHAWGLGCVHFYVLGYA